MTVVEPEPQENPVEVKAKDIFKSVSGSTGIIHTRIYRTDDREAD
jgi:hypothetical protein